MSKYIFLFRRKEDERDCCAYIERQPRFECNHYFGSVILHGPCYCNSDYPDYNDIETILTEKEYQTLIDYDNTINNLGHGIQKGDERYQRGLNAYADVKYIFDKLESDEGKEFENQIMKSEKEYMMDEYGLSEDDMDKIYDTYYLDYRDRGIIGYVFADAYDCEYEEAWSLGYVKKDDQIMERFFDYEKFGQALADEDQEYLELDNGRIVYLCY